MSNSSYSTEPFCYMSYKSHLAASKDITDTSLARKFFDEGNNLIKELKYDSAIVFLDKAKMIYEKESSWEDYFKLLGQEK